ncbi:Hypothetical predicted protein [Mytilus galloprovincialis]|uniref:Mab-21-like nucleotidyltransferase domain-containing protein n=1 Tax=Mytilus galloprovincialis TaxID=29158 RepID=A0A8B6FX27_MYTGA|nr:Hypothetical predicted protein [Mytilus galloprovincialis]
MAVAEKIADQLDTWRYLVFTVGPDEEALKQRILQNTYLENINITAYDWDEHCSAVDSVLEKILLILKKYANKEYEGLIIHGSIKQGSSREGLKVSDALEFDCLVHFEIEGMQVTKCPVFDYSGEEMPEFIKLRVENPEYLLRIYPWLRRCKIFTKGGLNDTNCYVNTKKLQEKVFKALVDKTREHIFKRLTPEDRIIYTYRRSVKPPSFPIQISLDREISYAGGVYTRVTLDGAKLPGQRKIPTLDIDIVPALLLRKDYVPNPYAVNNRNGEKEMTCAVYGVMKWTQRLHESELTIDRVYIWRESTCGYEKLISDVGRRNPSQRYLMTACRIVKSYVTGIKSNCRETNQLHCVAVSYFLKNICFHCIALLTVPSKTKSLSGVKEALGYFLQFLELCIKSRNLPHFFYGNPWVHVMFPNCTFGSNKPEKNLYGRICKNTFINAEKAFRKMLQDLKGLYTEFDSLDPDRVGPFKELLGLTHEYRVPE